MARTHLKIESLDVDVDLLTQGTVTLGEAAAIEKVIGVPFSKLDKDSAEVLAAFIWVSARRQNLALTIDDIRGVPFGELDLTNDEIGGDAADPSQPAAPASEDGDPTPSTTASAGTASA